MKTLTDFRKTVETGVDPRLIVIVSFYKQTNAAIKAEDRRKYENSNNYFLKIKPESQMVNLKEKTSLKTPKPQIFRSKPKKAS